MDTELSHFMARNQATVQSQDMKDLRVKSDVCNLVMVVSWLLLFGHGLSAEPHRQAE